MTYQVVGKINYPDTTEFEEVVLLSSQTPIDEYEVVDLLEAESSTLHMLYYTLFDDVYIETVV
ncbi:MAG: hypothetical protein KC421_20555 [Anaerolineales bacterium]|nr:hypothetical protein [Anaerolineales bacterium]